MTVPCSDVSTGPVDNEARELTNEQTNKQVIESNTRETT